MADIWEAKVELDAIKDGPVSQQQREWLARIELEPKAPGGLGREFAGRGRGDFRFVLGEIGAGDAVEFGSYDISSRGKHRYEERWYGAVLERTNSSIRIERYPDARAAITRARKIADALRAERRAAEENGDITVILQVPGSLRRRIMDNMPDTTTETDLASAILQLAESGLPV